MALSFSTEAQERIEKLLPRYPDKMAACLPLLWLAQEEFGWVSEEAMQLVAETLDLSMTHVYGVATFYTMYDKQRRGRFHLQLCTNVACMINDAYDVLSTLEKKLGIKCGETTEDGLFTLNEVECLAACGSGPCLQINDDYHEPVRPEDVGALIDKLRGEASGEKSDEAEAEKGDA